MTSCCISYGEYPTLWPTTMWRLSKRYLDDEGEFNFGMLVLAVSNVLPRHRSCTKAGGGTDIKSWRYDAALLGSDHLPGSLILPWSRALRLQAETPSSSAIWDLSYRDTIRIEWGDLTSAEHLLSHKTLDSYLWVLKIGVLYWISISGLPHHFLHPWY